MRIIAEIPGMLRINGLFRRVTRASMVVWRAIAWLQDKVLLLSPVGTSLMYKAIRPLLFSLSPEFAHSLALVSVRAAERCRLLPLLAPATVSDPLQLMGLEFPNRIGLAAGLDKNGECINGWEALGFGFIEIGTVTPLPQPGNPRPRMFRLPEREALINRMGFNNDGVEVLADNVRRARQRGLRVPLGINIGKNKVTEQERAVEDYRRCLEAVYPLADYITLNLSSPNTPGLRDLQFGDALDTLLEAIDTSRQALADRHGLRRPLLVKVAPDMAEDDLKAVADKLQRWHVDGVIATNTTIDRQSVAGCRHAEEAGGLSGKVLFDASTRCVEVLASHLQGAMVIVGVGGIHNAETALAKRAAGADLLQLYSGLIYEGPGLVSAAARALDNSA